MPVQERQRETEEARSVPATPQEPNTVLCHLVLYCIIPSPAMSKQCSAPFLALMWAWSTVGLHLECVGQSIIPLCKYLHKETSRLALAKSPSVELSFPEPYTAMTRESQRLEPSESRGGGGGRDGERKKKVRRLRMIGHIESEIRILKK